MACTVSKEKGEHKKQCDELQACLDKGYDKPLATNIWDAFGGSLKETASVATVVGLLGLYAMR